MKTALVVVAVAFVLTFAFNNLMAGAGARQAAIDSLPVALIAGAVSAFMVKRRMQP